MAETNTGTAENLPPASMEDKSESDFFVDLTSAETALLSELINDPEVPVRTARRARILLMSQLRIPALEISRKLDIARGSVYNCTRKYRTNGARGAVFDEARSGGPRRISDESIEWMRSVVSQSPRHCGIEQDRWSVTSLREYVVNHAEKAGYPEVASISRTRLWSLIFTPRKKPKKAHADSAKRPEEVNIFWMPVYLPLLLHSDGRVTFEKIEFPEFDRSARSTANRRGLELLCYVGVDSSSCRLHVSVARSSDEKPFLEFLDQIDKAVSANTKVSLSRASAVLLPEYADDYLKNRHPRFTVFEPFIHDVVPGLCAALAAEVCRRRLGHLTGSGIRDLADRAFSALDGYRALPQPEKR